MITGPYDVKYEYTGLSTDTKPTDRVFPGSRFLELDTGSTYVYSEGSGWIQFEQTVTGPLTNDELRAAAISVSGTFWPSVQAVSNTLDDPLAKYKASDMDEASISYYGFLDADGNWYIMKITNTTIRYAKGSSNYADNWNGRATLTYNYFSEVF